jgi:hypothetical protein
MLRLLISAVVAGLVLAGTPPVQAKPASVDTSWPRFIGWKGCPAPTWPSRLSQGSPGEGRRVLVIGDSLTRDGRIALRSALVKDGWTPTVRCWGGKRLDWGIDQVRRAKKLKQLPDTVVLALGTNDMRLIPFDVTKERSERILNEIGPDRTVIWVNMHFGGGVAPSRAREDQFNRWLRDLAKSRPNLRVVEWADYARANGIRSRDGLHYRSDGSKARAEMVRQELAKLVAPKPADPEPAPQASPSADPGTDPPDTPKSRESHAFLRSASEPSTF